MFNRPSQVKNDAVLFARKYCPQGLLDSRIVTGSYRSALSLYRTVKRHINPYKGARVFVRRGITRKQFFEKLNERKIDYVLLRWWQDFPEMPLGEDMDILIRDNHRDLIEDLVTFRNYGTELKCDVYTVEGSRFGSHNSLPYFQNNLSNVLLQTRRMYRGVYVPGEIPYFASLAYHALFHKGYNSGLPGFDRKPAELEHNYFNILSQEAARMRLKIDISALGIYNWLHDHDFVPAEDTLSKLAEIRTELASLQKPLFSDIRGGEFLVFIIRERLLNEGFLENFTKFLQEEFKFAIIDVRLLDDEEKAILRSRIRGGKWDKGPYKLSGGYPVAIVSAFDFKPYPLDESILSAQSRMTNGNNYNAKAQFRTYLNGFSSFGDYNGVHSADNEIDAFSYISVLGNDYLQRTRNQVEAIRVQYTQHRSKIL